MIKVFLAEDEFVIREAIKKTIDWEQEGYELIGEAGDGETALEKLRENHADILITDIRMPFMDGLELAGYVRKELPETLVVILSGYDDFAYAREAIRLGVTEYMLKPVTGSILLETLSKVSGQLDQRRKVQKNKEIYRQQYQPEHEQNLEQKKQDIYRSMTAGDLDFGSAMQASQQLDIRISADYYCVLLVELFRRQGSSGGAHTASGADAVQDEQLDRLRKKFMQEVCSHKYIGGYKDGSSRLCLIIMANERTQLQERLDETIRHVAALLEADDDMFLKMGAGSIAEGIEQVPVSYEWALQELADQSE